MATKDPLLLPLHGTSVERGRKYAAAHPPQLTAKQGPQEAFLRDVLVRVPMLEGCNLHQILKLIQAMEAFRALPRQCLVKFGDANDKLFVVEAGALNFAQPGSLPKTLKAGDFFGQEALDLGGHAEYTVVSTGSATLWTLDRSAFKTLQALHGAKLREAIGTVMERNRAARATPLPAMQSIALLALEKKRDEAQLHRSLVAYEFHDVPGALEQFKRVKVIGSGAFGEVVLGFHAPTRKAYAMKKQKSAGLQPGSELPLREMIDREVACMQEAACPYLMRFYGEHDPDGTESYMLFEYLGGGSLEGRLGNGTGTRGPDKGLALADARFYFACCVAAIDAMHAAAWMHRDLSAKNVSGSEPRTHRVRRSTVRSVRRCGAFGARRAAPRTRLHCARRR